MERDVRGRFLPGNQVARGNRGNRQPKYGNNNAMKHGLYSQLKQGQDKRASKKVLQLGNTFLRCFLI